MREQSPQLYESISSTVRMIACARKLEHQKDLDYDVEEADHHGLWEAPSQQWPLLYQYAVLNLITLNSLVAHSIFIYSFSWGFEN